MGMVGGGEGAFIGAVHRMAAALDGEIELVCGAFSRDVSAQIPDGYDLQIDGTLEVDASVPATPTSFGAVKSLFRN